MTQPTGAVSTEPESFWEILLQLIEEGQVVPIIGPDLLVIDTPKGKISLYAYLAEQLANHIGVSTEELPVGGELNEVACRFLHQGNQVEDIYPALKAITVKADSFPIPQPLLQLADIRPLKLFVTTTFDSFLIKALNQQRFGGTVKASICTYSPYEVQDIPREVIGAGVPIVYHLLGRASSTPAYAVTQEDIVEFMHTLHSETHRPSLLFDELNRQSLLLLGNRFTGWLARFFLRMAKSGRLSSGGKSDYIADPEISNDTKQVLFLKSFSRTTKIYRSGEAVDFVAELHRRWIERHPTSIEVAPKPTDLSDMERGAVFLSYASGDKAAVEKIKAALEAAGVDVWFDRDQLQGGDAWDTKIRRNVQNCSLFMPVISRQTLTPDRRYFRVEWNLALAEAQKVSFSHQEAFLFPVAIDDTKQNDPSLPEQFQSIQWTSLLDGEPTPDFIARVQQLFRKYQKSQSGVS